MSRPRTVLVGFAVWCGVVAAVASLVWVVIARAGAGVVPASEPQAAATGSLPAPHQRLHSPSASAGVVLSPRHSSSPEADPATTTTTRAAPATTAGPAPLSASDPTSSPAPVLPSSVATSAAPPAAPAAQRRSWSGAAGHVVAECRATAARLVSAYPNTGWRYQILSRGPASVRVRFLQNGDDNGVTVTARCVAGVPHFSVSGKEPGDR